MNDYVGQVLGPISGSGSSDLRSDQREAVEKMIRKMGKSGKNKKGKRTKRKLKKLEEQLQVLAANHQRLLELENERHKKKHKRKGKGKKGRKNQAKQLKALEPQCQQQCLQDAALNLFLKLLGSATVSVNWLPPQSQPVIELPPPRGQK